MANERDLLAVRYQFLDRPRKLIEATRENRITSSGVDLTSPRARKREIALYEWWIFEEIKTQTRSRRLRENRCSRQAQIEQDRKTTNLAAVPE